MSALPHMVSQHAEEAAIQWRLRDLAVDEPHYSLADLVNLDERVDAHLDGLQVAGDAGWEACLEELAWKEAGEVFAAGFIALSSGIPQRIGQVMEVAVESVELLRPFVSALGWLHLDQALPHVRSLLEDEQPLHLHLGIAGAAVHRWHPGPILGRLVSSEDPVLRCRALKAVGELGDRQLTGELLYALRDSDLNCVFAAAWSGTLLGMPACLSVLQAIAETPSDRAPAAAELALRRMDHASAMAWHSRVQDDPELARAAIRAAGAIGDPALVPWLLSLMGQPGLVRLAGEAYTMITGVDLAYRDLDRRPSADFEAGPNEDPADPAVAMDPDENLPWPEPDLVSRWWDDNAMHFKSGTRYLLGKPITPDWLITVRRDGRQRQRAAASLELAILAPDKPLFNVNAMARSQQRLLGKGKLIR